MTLPFRRKHIQKKVPDRAITRSYCHLRCDGFVRSSLLFWTRIAVLERDFLGPYDSSLRETRFGRRKKQHQMNLFSWAAWLHVGDQLVSQQHKQILVFADEILDLHKITR